VSKDNFILEAQGVFKSYRMGATKVDVLKGVDLAIKQGEFVAIVGTSGSGKSTLLHIMGGLDRPDKGAVKFHGKDIAEMSGGIHGYKTFFISLCFFVFLVSVVVLWLSGYDRRLVNTIAVPLAMVFATMWWDSRRRARKCKGAVTLNEFRNKKVGFVFQFYHLLDELNVLENVFLPAMASKSIVGWFAARRWARRRAGELLEQLGLAERANHKPYQLSGGERQRVAIGRALMNEPRLLLADEPTGNLDSATGNGILSVLEKLNKAGQTIVMVSHDERIAHRAGRVIRLADGKIQKT